jgi:IS1 family transposase
MNKLTTKERAAILTLLCEGTSISATCRITGAAKNTVQKLLLEVGQACADYHDNVMRNLTCTRVECDELWGFIGMKEKNVPKELRGSGIVGDCYVWIAMDPETKLIPCWHIGTRSWEHARIFMDDLARRLGNRIQLSTDGHHAYIQAVERAFGGQVDFGQVIKTYSAPQQSREASRRYSPSKVIGAEKSVVSGNPDMSKVSTSLIERANLTVRMHNRRFTRLTNAFSKKLANHTAAISLHFQFYNYCRVHKSLRVTPAMEAGLTDHVWEMEEVVMMADTNEFVTEKLAA